MRSSVTAERRHPPPLSLTTAFRHLRSLAIIAICAASPPRQSRPIRRLLQISDRQGRCRSCIRRMSLSKAMSSPTPGPLVGLQLSPDVTAAAYGGSPSVIAISGVHPCSRIHGRWPCSPSLWRYLQRMHEIVGNRFFPATLAIDDPGVTDELALPTISMSKTGVD